MSWGRVRLNLTSQTRAASADRKLTIILLHNVPRYRWQDESFAAAERATTASQTLLEVWLILNVYHSLGLPRRWRVVTERELAALRSGAEGMQTFDGRSDRTLTLAG